MASFLIPFRVRRAVLPLVAIAMVWPAFSYGMSDLCEYYSNHAPEMYKLLCKKGSASSKPAGANSTFSDSFNISSASLPTEPSSYGLETIGSFLRSRAGVWTPTFSIVKGFHKFGTGFSTSGNNTFYGNDVVQRLSGKPEVDSFKPHEAARGKLMNLNLGTAIALRESKGKGPGIQLGLSARYNNTTATWGGGPAVLFAWSHFSLGAGFTREAISNALPRLTFTSIIASARFWILELEYTQLNESGNQNVLSPIDIWTLTANVKRFTFTAAMRRLDYLSDGAITQNHFAVQYLFSSVFSAGLLYNYIPGATSVGIQYYL